MTEVQPRFKAERVRSEKHLARIKRQRCSIGNCWGKPVDAHHLKCGPEGGGSVVASDCWAVPLCRWGHHVASARDGVHSTGDERAWWTKHGIDPIALAEYYAETSRAMGLLPKESTKCSP